MAPPSPYDENWNLDLLAIEIRLNDPRTVSLAQHRDPAIVSGTNVTRDLPVERLGQVTGGEHGERDPRSERVSLDERARSGGH
jgi:hypothetical protein